MNEFDICYGIKDIPDGYDVIRRNAAKAVVEKDGKVLLIHTNKGDYKFPGGGYENGESPVECLSRELLEETGYNLDELGDRLGVVLEQNPDKFDENKFFSMRSEYYNVKVGEKVQDQNLDDYEKELDFRPVFVEYQKAIQNNEDILVDENRKQNPWVRRETDVLKLLAKSKKEN